MNTTTTLFLRSDPAMYTSPGRTYARVGVRDPARMYTYVAVFSFLHPGRCTYVYKLRVRLYYDTYAPLLQHVRASTSTSIYVRTRSRPERQRYVRFDQVGLDCQALPCVRRFSWWVPAVRGAKYGGPPGGSLLSGGGIIILRVIRRHFLWAAVDPAVSLSTYSSTLPMEVIP